MTALELEPGKPAPPHIGPASPHRLPSESPHLQNSNRANTIAQQPSTLLRAATGCPLMPSPSPLTPLLTWPTNTATPDQHLLHLHHPVEWDHHLELEHQEHFLGEEHQASSRVHYWVHLQMISIEIVEVHQEHQVVEEVASSFQVVGIVVVVDYALVKVVHQYFEGWE